MSKSKKMILFLALFTIIFVGLVLIATFYDYRISEILVGGGLHDGNYYSTNIFGRIFEVLGEMPLYFFVCFATAILFNWLAKLENKGLRITFSVILFVFGSFANLYGWYKFGGYLAKLHPDSSFFTLLHGNLLIYGVYALLSFGFEVLVIFLLKTKFAEINDKMVPLAILILFLAFISQGIVQGIKPLFGRERFRALYFFSYRNVADQGFTNWYVMNGDAGKIVEPYLVIDGVTKDFFKSFPSGHTTAAGTVYALIFVPFLFKKYDNVKSKVIFTLIPICFTGLVAIARIVMGAHYMSDVLFGGTISFLSAIAAYYLTRLLNKKLNYMEWIKAK